jgi:hypothetical protein
VVHHLVEDYSLADGSPDWERYNAMGDDEVVVICKRCHFVWTKFGARPDDPRLKCPRCGGFKRPQFRVCDACELASGSVEDQRCVWSDPLRFPRPPWRFVPAQGVDEPLPDPIVLVSESDGYGDGSPADKRAPYQVPSTPSIAVGRRATRRRIPKRVF